MSAVCAKPKLITLKNCLTADSNTVILPLSSQTTFLCGHGCFLSIQRMPQLLDNLPTASLRPKDKEKPANTRTSSQQRTARISRFGVRILLRGYTPCAKFTDKCCFLYTLLASLFKCFFNELKQRSRLCLVLKGLPLKFNAMFGY